jgi:hypothetical protein
MYCSDFYILDVPNSNDLRNRSEDTLNIYLRIESENNVKAFSM